MAPLISHDDMKQVVRTMYASPDYHFCPKNEWVGIFPGSFVKYIVRSGPHRNRLYKVGAGFFKNATFSPEHQCNVLWFHSKRREEPFKIFEKNLRCVFVKDRIGERLAQRIEGFERLVAAERQANHNENLLIMKAVAHLNDKSSA